METISWKVHADRLCFYSRNRTFVSGVDHKIMLLFHQAALESLIRYGMETPCDAVMTSDFTELWPSLTFQSC